MNASNFLSGMFGNSDNDCGHSGSRQTHQQLQSTVSITQQVMQQEEFYDQCKDVQSMLQKYWESIKKIRCQKGKLSAKDRLELQKRNLNCAMASNMLIAACQGVHMENDKKSLHLGAIPIAELQQTILSEIDTAQLMVHQFSLFCFLTFYGCFVFFFSRLFFFNCDFLSLVGTFFSKMQTTK